MDLAALQDQHAVWVNKNFPNQNPLDGFLGVVEEVGEMSHAILKRSQGIRGDEEMHDAAIEDAIGDIVIFLASYCNTNRISLDRCVSKAWAEVIQRDWINHKNTGVANGAI